MRYIFLDVDGVLNNTTYTKKCYKKNGHKPFFCDNVPFDPKCLKRLAKIVRKTNAILVLTSTWRLSKTSVAILNSRLAEYGVRVDNFTENYNHIRGLEIKRWLKGSAFNCDKDTYIVLDDEIDDIETHIFPNRIIEIDPKLGLTWYNMRDAIIRLKE